MPTIAEQWFKEGEVVGFEKGEASGLEKGREATLTLLRRYLATRFGLELDHFDLDFAAVLKLSELVFAVESLAAFETNLADLKAEGVAKKKAPPP